MKVVSESRHLVNGLFSMFMQTSYFVIALNICVLCLSRCKPR